MATQHRESQSMHTLLLRKAVPTHLLATPTQHLIIQGTLTQHQEEAIRARSTAIQPPEAVTTIQHQTPIIIQHPAYMDHQLMNRHHLAMVLLPMVLLQKVMEHQAMARHHMVPHLMEPRHTALLQNMQLHTPLRHWVLLHAILDCYRIFGASLSVDLVILKRPSA